ncbi:MAG: hypothetical protein LQ347_004102 [Umbilicaria vellea]|nr:MAG: hypothetical protein LQ347_004102 [Umbilicaria vellea]
MPRLSYRDSANGTILHGRHDSANTAPTMADAAADSTAASSSSPSDYEPSSPPPSKAAAVAQSTVSPDAVSLTGSTLSPETPTKASKKRGSSLFGFLGVKEPSQQAFLDYQESIRKQTAVRSGRITAVGMPGVSSARLPPTVPKVNSRWDGVPQTLKEKEKETKEALRPLSMSHQRSSNSTTTRGLKFQRSTSTLGSQRSNKKSHSFFGNKAGNTSDKSVTEPGWEAYTLSNGSGSKNILPTLTDSAEAPLTPALPEMTSVYPQDVPEPPKIPAQYRSKASIEAPSYLDVPQYSMSPSLTPAETSPVTPYPPSSPTDAFISVRSKPETITEDDFKDTGKLFHRLEQVKLNSNGAHILAPPTTKRRPNGYGFRDANADQGQPLTEDDRPPPVLKLCSSGKRPEVCVGPAISSYFPVIDPEPKRRSNVTHKRHDPSMIVRTRDIAPWEWDEPPTNGARDASPTPTKQTGKANMRKKLSVFGR